MSRAEKIAVMDSIAESPVIEGRVAGLAVAVVQGSDTLLFKSYGKAHLEWDVPMAVDAVFEISSVTKQFTAAAALMLRDEGKLDFEADLTEYLPDYPTQGHRIPVRRLLDHTSRRPRPTSSEAWTVGGAREEPFELWFGSARDVGSRSCRAEPTLLSLLFQKHRRRHRCSVVGSDEARRRRKQGEARH